MHCAVSESSRILGKKWSIPIIEELAVKNTGSFNKLLTNVGAITSTTLSRHLHELEAAGIIRKISHSREKTVSTSYAITRKGMELHRLLIEIKKWNIKWNGTPNFCVHTPCSDCSYYRNAQTNRVR
ncbi:MAG: helix-turn-helix transcriptional regulator [Candidatus Aenigmarchaeota archaeon]|nr:helix-turn-helix transcriptional regulator [Candidatus Aenigmarchaeota archaeon]